MDRFTQRVVLGIAVLAGASSVAAQDRVVLKSSRVLTGTVVRDTRSEVELVDDEIGHVHVPWTVIRAVEREGQSLDTLGLPAPAAPGERPNTYVRWVRDGDDQGLETGTARWHHADSDTTVFLVGVVHIADRPYFGQLQRFLDSCDLVLFEGVGRGAATDEDLARLDTMMQMQLSLRGALGLDFQKDCVEYDRSFWRNSDVPIDEVLAELESRGASLPTDNPLLAGLTKMVLGIAASGGERDPTYRDSLKSRVGPILAKADEIMSRPAMSGMRGAILEHRNAHVVTDLEREFAGGPRGRRIAVFYGAGHLPDLDDRLEALGLRFEGAAWHRAWDIAPKPIRSRDARAPFDAIVREAIDAHGDDGLEVSAWIGPASGMPWFTRDAGDVRAAASAIKTAYLVELFAAFEDSLDEPLAGLDAILDDPDHPALVHFEPEVRAAVVQKMRGVSARRVAQMMIHGIGVDNATYNAAANVTTAVLGGPEGLTERLTARFGPGAAVRRYMLARRDVTGDNEVSAEFLARVLSAVASGHLPGIRARTIEAIRDQLFLEIHAEGSRHLSKTGALDTDPMTRISSGILVRPDAEPLVYAVMCQRADPGSRSREDAVSALEASEAALTRALLDAASGRR
ncbi:MAG: serine hydrolase [Planctomycetota bacterium]|nr:serine hydrolase [Planctomycetota bacterium]